MGKPKPNQLRQLQELARPYGDNGWELLRYVIQRWQDQRPKGIVGLNEPWFFFFKEVDAGRIKRMVDESSELLKVADPSAYQAWMKEIEQNAARLHDKEWGHNKPKEPEVDDSEFLKDVFGKPNTSGGQ